MNRLPPPPLLPFVRPCLVAALTVAAAWTISNALPSSLAGTALQEAAATQSTTQPATAPATQPTRFSVEAIRRDVTWLASDERAGRGIRTPGLEEAAGYIADRFENLGLAKAPGMESYFQAFDLPFGSALVEEKTVLAAESVEPMVLGVQFNPLAWSTPGQFEGELVFGGYAINSPRYEYNDFGEVDVKGKVVLALRYEPHKEDGESRFTNSPQFSREAALFAKARDAEEAGAAALLIVDPPQHHEDGNELMEFGTGSTRAGIPVFHIKQQAAQSLLRAAGLPDLETLQQRIDSTGQPASAASPDGLVVRGGFGSAPQTYELKNVVGMVPGRKSDEYVVVGAHYDHVGLGSYGSSYGYGAIHNGADDNASGTATVLALAEAFAQAEEKPERTILFVLFTAEEIGLVGSEKFVENSPVPLEQMVAMVNLDMVGRVRNDQLWVGGYEAAAVLPDILEQADEASPLSLGNMGTSFSDRSDHANFNRRQIPAVFLFSGLHEQYHSPQDDPELINYEGMAQVAELAEDVIRAIAATPRQELAFQAPQAREMLEQAAPPAARRQAEDGDRPRLGVTLEPIEGIRVADVLDDSAADRAGLQAGDILLSVDGRAISRVADLINAINTAGSGSKVTLAIDRAGERQEIVVTLDK